MMRKVVRARFWHFVVVLSVFAVQSVPAQVRLIGVHGGSGTGEENMVGAVSRVNQNNGNLTFLGTPLPGAGITGVATDSSGRVFASTGWLDEGADGPRLIEIDPTTGALLNDVGRLLDSEGRDCYVGDLSFQPGTDILFGMRGNQGGASCGEDNIGGWLLTINTSNARVTVIGKDESLGNSNGGIAFAPDGTLYFTPCWTTDSVLLTLNPATGNILTSTDLQPGTCYMGLAVRPTDGRLFASFDWENFEFPLVTLNPNTGVATLVADTSPQMLHDLTFVGGQAFAINAGINDAWFNPATNGQGFFIIVFPDIPLVFLAWFTYDTVRPDASVEATLGDPGHRWITAQGPFAGDTAMLDVVVTRGGVFDSGDPAPENTTEGTIEVVFESCTKGVVKYNIPALVLMGEVPIQRIANDNVPLCEELAGQ